MRNSWLNMFPILLTLLLISCQQPQAPEPVGNIALELVFADGGVPKNSLGKHASRQIDDDFSRVHATVYRDSSTEWDNDLNSIGSTFQAAIELDEGTGYWVDVEAYLNDILCYIGSSDIFSINGGETKNVSVVMSADFPDAPSDLVVTLVSGPAINLQWTDNSENERWFIIERKIGISGSWNPTDTVAQDITAHQIDGLSNFMDYFYRVYAYNPAGASGYSNEESVSTYYVWERTFGGGDEDRGFSIRQTSDGGFIIVGDTYSYGAGNSDIYLIKTDASGNELWSHTYGGISNDESSCIQLTSDGGYIIAGGTESYGAGDCDVYLVKTDASGNEQWSNTYGGSAYDRGRFVLQTNDDGYVIVGNTYSFGAGDNDVYLIKTDASGDTTWTKTFGGINDERGDCVQQTADGGYIITGLTWSFSSGHFDVYLIKTDASGSEEWYQTFGGNNEDAGKSVQQTIDGGYIITGYTYSYGAGGDDLWLIKTNSNGNVTWDHTFGDYSLDGGNFVQPTSDDGYIVTGWNSAGAGLADLWLIKTDVYGNSEWDYKFGGSLDDVGSVVQQTTDGGFIMVGTTESSGAGSHDVYLVKIGPVQ